MDTTTVAKAVETLQQHHLYTDMRERLSHFGEVEAIAASLHRSLPEIAPLYEDVLGQLKCQARLHDYLPILVSKKVRAICQNRQ